jgi:hypothetical protein
MEPARRDELALFVVPASASSWAMHTPVRRSGCRPGDRGRMRACDTQPARRTQLLVVVLGIASIVAACGNNQASPGAARRYQQAASHPKELRWYAAGHALNCTARQDMIAWLARHIPINPKRYKCQP